MKQVIGWSIIVEIIALALIPCYVWWVLRYTDFLKKYIKAAKLEDEKNAITLKALHHRARAIRLKRLMNAKDTPA